MDANTGSGFHRRAIRAQVGGERTRIELIEGLVPVAVAAEFVAGGHNCPEQAGEFSSHVADDEESGVRPVALQQIEIAFDQLFERT